MGRRSPIIANSVFVKMSNVTHCVLQPIGAMRSCATAIFSNYASNLFKRSNTNFTLWFGTAVICRNTTPAGGDPGFCQGKGGPASEAESC